MMTSCSLTYKGNIIDIKFDKNSHIEDIGVFDKYNEITFNGTVDEAMELNDVLDFALNYNFTTNEDDRRTGLEDDRQEVA